MKGNPMLWNALLILFAISSIAFTVAYFKSGSTTNEYGYTRSTRSEGLGAGSVISIATLVVLLIVSLFATSANKYDVSVYKRSDELVDMKREQRDELATIVQRELSNEQFAQLMAATPEADVLVILGNQASGIMVERSKQLVGLNNELYEKVNDLAEKRIQLCAFADNPLSPRMFVGPECPDPIPLEINDN